MGTNSIRRPRAERLHLIKEDHVRAEGLCCTYRLYEHCEEPLCPRYSVEVTVGCENACAPLPGSFAEAARIYELLLYGLVTPCTLPDIIRDLGEEG